MKKVGGSSLNELIQNQVIWNANGAELEGVSCHEGRDPFAALPFFSFQQREIHEICLDLGDEIEGVSPHTFIALILRGLVKKEKETKKDAHGSKRYIFWIGHTIRPSPFLLRDSELLAQDHGIECIFLNPQNENLFKWSVEIALRSSSTLAVIAYAKRYSFSVSRTFSLAAKEGDSLGILVKDLKLVGVPTAATSTWLLTPLISTEGSPTWKLELLRAKGKRPTQNEWFLEYRYGKEISLHLFPNVVRESHQEETYRFGGQ